MQSSFFFALAKSPPSSLPCVTAVQKGAHPAQFYIFRASFFCKYYFHILGTFLVVLWVQASMKAAGH